MCYRIQASPTLAGSWHGGPEGQGTRPPERGQTSYIAKLGLQISQVSQISVVKCYLIKLRTQCRSTTLPLHLTYPVEESQDTKALRESGDHVGSDLRKRWSRPARVSGLVRSSSGQDLKRANAGVSELSRSTKGQQQQQPSSTCPAVAIGRLLAHSKAHKSRKPVGPLSCTKFHQERERPHPKRNSHKKPWASFWPAVFVSETLVRSKPCFAPLTMTWDDYNYHSSPFFLPLFLPVFHDLPPLASSLQSSADPTQRY